MASSSRRPRAQRRLLPASRVVLPVPAFAQREAECGNTSLKAALWYLGHRVSAAELGRLAGTNREGTEHAGLVAAALACGAAVFERKGGSVDELRFFLRRGLPLVIGWWSRAAGDAHLDPSWSLAQRRARDCGHFSVVSGIDATRVALMDPDPQLISGRWRAVPRRWMLLSEFRRVWYDTDTPAFRLVEAWYMVVHTSDERFAPLLGGGVDHRAPRHHAPNRRTTNRRASKLPAQKRRATPRR